MSPSRGCGVAGARHEGSMKCPQTPPIHPSGHARLIGATQAAAAEIRGNRAPRGRGGRRRQDGLRPQHRGPRCRPRWLGGGGPAAVLDAWTGLEQAGAPRGHARQPGPPSSPGTPHGPITCPGVRECPWGGSWCHPGVTGDTGEDGHCVCPAAFPSRQRSSGRIVPRAQNPTPRSSRVTGGCSPSPAPPSVSPPRGG